MEMSDFEQHELGFPGSRRANLKLRRGIYLLPSSMTVANMLCGFYAVMATLKGGGTDLDNAAKAIGLAIVFDSFDGFVARATKPSKESKRMARPMAFAALSRSVLPPFSVDITA